MQAADPTIGPPGPLKSISLEQYGFYRYGDITPKDTFLALRKSPGGAAASAMDDNGCVYTQDETNFGFRKAIRQAPPPLFTIYRQHEDALGQYAQQQALRNGDRPTLYDLLISNLPFGPPSRARSRTVRLTPAEEAWARLPRSENIGTQARPPAFKTGVPESPARPIKAETGKGAPAKGPGAANKTKVGPTTEGESFAPGSPAHKAQRWIDYQAKNVGNDKALAYDQWSKRYDVAIQNSRGR